jgi:hypothetical protein
MVAVEAQYSYIRERIDTIDERQIGQVQSLQAVHDTLNNGLADKINRTIESTISKMCSQYEMRLKPIEEFAWFRTWITGIKDGLFKKAVILIASMTVILTIFHMSEKFAGLLLKLVLQ